MPGITMISATPSPFARMNRIALIEKGVPFELRNEIPWHKDTETPKYNPLEKLPILLFDDGREPVYDSSHIQEYIVQKYADKAPRLITGDVDTDLKARQIQTLAQGILDAYVLVFFESSRPQDKQSSEWMARQNRKIDGGLKAFEELVKKRESGSEYLLANQFTIADIALSCCIAQIDFGKMRPQWQEEYPELKKYWEKMETKESFKQTTPVMFDIRRDTVV
ncbi:glutathione S-transferase [Lecanosticta acicola]|uniref:Glutathione S-transferase n=1 Tax=Lecanosticta acicola TaxID=111012 RepID=A0AAI8YZR8_9PEZI|nr:glutathione S-transferase [Lecanosticta acicola]